MGCFSIFLILDIFSRKLVGWEIHPEQTSEPAATLFRQALDAKGS